MTTKKKFSFKNWRYNDDVRVHSVSGDPVVVRYIGEYDDLGELKLVETGRENLYEYIQSFKESCDINNILERYSLGDTGALDKVQGIYMDATKVPKNMADLLNKLNRAEDDFNKLPVEIKEKYGNDFARFICTFSPEKLTEVVSEQIVEKEVKTDESEQ